MLKLTATPNTSTNTDDAIIEVLTDMMYQLKAGTPSYDKLEAWIVKKDWDALRSVVNGDTETTDAIMALLEYTHCDYPLKFRNALRMALFNAAKAVKAAESNTAVCLNLLAQLTAAVRNKAAEADTWPHYGDLHHLRSQLETLTHMFAPQPSDEEVNAMVDESIDMIADAELDAEMENLL